MQLSALLKEFDSIWPPATAEAWDRPGLMLGNPDKEIRKILLTVDITAIVIEQAVEMNIDLIVAHHPMFLRGVFELNELGFRGANAATAIKSDIAIFSAHTNADFQLKGVTNSLARAVGISNPQPFSANGSGAIGEIDQAMSLLDYSRLVAKVLPAVAAGVKVAGDPAKIVKKVAVLAGAGDSYLAEVLQSGADVYITSDLRHHSAQDFMEQSNLVGGPALIDISHWSAEWMWLETAASQLQTFAPECQILVSDINTDPWNFAVMQ